MKQIPAIVFLFLSVTSCAQKKFDCKAFLARELNIDPAKVTEDFKELDHYRECGGLDSFDMNTLVTGPVIGTIMMQGTMDGKKVTYGYVLDELKKIAANPDYQAAKKGQPK